MMSGTKVNNVTSSLQQWLDSGEKPQSQCTSNPCREQEVIEDQKPNKIIFMNPYYSFPNVGCLNLNETICIAVSARLTILESI
jgi:hypothetical protein